MELMKELMRDIKDVKQEQSLSTETEGNKDLKRKIQTKRPIKGWDECHEGKDKQIRKGSHEKRISLYQV